MPDFDDSRLWRISEFERARSEHRTTGYGDRQTLFSSTLQAELDTLRRDPTSGDALEVLAALRRQNESALLYLSYEKLVWPVTIFPAEMVYHSPRDLLESSEVGLRAVRPLLVEPPGILPPGHWKHERVGRPSHYRPLAPLLWAMALKGPRKELLGAIGGAAAYRTLRDPKRDGHAAPGAMGAALERLAREPVSLRELTSLPGMSPERAARLLNGLYLVSNLMVTRAGSAARRESRFGFPWGRR